MPGTTLINPTITVNPFYVTRCTWTIDKSVTPDMWDLNLGGSGTSQYTIVVTKDGNCQDIAFITGTICVTNGGAEATQNLTITTDLEVNPGGGFQPVISGQSVDVSSNPVLDPNETGCYNYLLNIPKVPDNKIFPGANYRVTANITITNHAPGNTIGGTQVTGAADLPEEPIPETIRVTDTNGQTFNDITDTTTLNYDKTFFCGDAGTHTNTATIVFQNGEIGPSDEATVTVYCRARGLNLVIMPNNKTKCNKHKFKI